MTMMRSNPAKDPNSEACTKNSKLENPNPSKAIYAWVSEEPDNEDEED